MSAQLDELEDYSSPKMGVELLFEMITPARERSPITVTTIAAFK